MGPALPVKAKARRTTSSSASSEVRPSGLFLRFCCMFFSAYLKEDERSFFLFEQISRILLILTIGWLIIQIVRALFHFWRKKFDIQNPDNWNAKKG